MSSRCYFCRRTYRRTKAVNKKIEYCFILLGDIKCTFLFKRQLQMKYVCFGVCMRAGERVFVCVTSQRVAFFPPGKGPRREKRQKWVFACIRLTDALHVSPSRAWSLFSNVTKLHINSAFPLLSPRQKTRFSL